MKAAIYKGPAKHQIDHAEAMAAGLKRHGVKFDFFSDNNVEGDFVITWGWRRGEFFKSKGVDVLVMERGYLGDRFKWTSLGWNGLNGRATWNGAHDDGERFRNNFNHIVRDSHRTKNDGYALVVGQVSGDMSIKRANIDGWYREAEAKLKSAGFDVRFRQHPVAKERGHEFAYSSLDGNLSDAIDGAAIVVTYNSNTGVDSLVRDVPTIACNDGSMAWPIANRGLDDLRLTVRDRSEWFRDLSWRQWTLDEIRSGFAWDIVGKKPAKRIRTALVLGGGVSVWTDAEDAFNNYQIDTVIAINNCVADYPGHIDAALTLHPVKMLAWLEERKARNYPDPRYVIAHEDKHGKRTYPYVTNVLGYKWPEMAYSGSSGLYAVKAAFEMFNVDRVILAGVPMTPSADHYHKRGVPWNDAEAFFAAWKSTLPRLQGRVKSYSGKTAELLGKPSRDWANGTDN